MRRFTTASRPRIVATIAAIAVLSSSARVPNVRAGAQVEAAHRVVSTGVPAAQAAFDLGLTMLYAFNIGQARDEFARAATLDPDCAMASWGESLAEITDINLPPDAAGIERGLAAIRRAQAASEATPAERALIAAAAERFAPKRTEDERKTAYAKAMRAYAVANAGDADGLVETAFAVWGLPSDVAAPENADIGKDLDAALALDPNQIGALHLRIHYEEAVLTPERALANADALSAMTFAPGESHLAHMAGHIYDRVGDYPKMIAANERALANDDVYFSSAKTLYPDTSDAGVRYMHRYRAHDLAFVLYGYTTVGRASDALAAATREDATAVAQVDIRLHRARLALASGTTDATVLAIAGARLEKNLSPRARAIVVAERASARGDRDAALAAYADAYKRANADDLGDPKHLWYAPAGEAYGHALLRAKRFADAETVFTAELKRFPNDPRLLLGLATAQDARDESSAATRAREAAYWQGSVPPILDDLAGDGA